jgi:hypothetical protein
VAPNVVRDELTNGYSPARLRPVTAEQAPPSGPGRQWLLETVTTKIPEIRVTNSPRVAPSSKHPSGCRRVRGYRKTATVLRPPARTLHSHLFAQENFMEPLHEALRLIKRQTELENAMRRPGGIRITEERELYQLRSILTQYPAAVSAIMDTASRMRRSVDTLSAEDIESLALSSTH